MHSTGALFYVYLPMVRDIMIYEFEKIEIF